MKTITLSLLAAVLFTLAVSVRVERHREYVAVRIGDTLLWSHDWISEPPVNPHEPE